MVLFLNILMGVCLATGFILLVYTGFVLPHRFFKATGNMMRFRCRTCGEEHTYTNKETAKIIRSPRNQYTTIVSGKITRKISYRYLCACCGVRAMQELLGSLYTVEQAKAIRRKQIILCIVLWAAMIVGRIVGIRLDKMS